MKSLKQTFAAAESARHAQIYRVAAALFCEQGFASTAMSEIAAAVGVTKAALYYFVPGGKQELLYAVMSFGLDRLEEQVIAPARGIADAETRLRAIIRDHLRIITEGMTARGYNPVTIVVEETGGLNKTQRRQIDQRKRAYVDLIRDTLRQLRAEEKLSALDETVAAFSLLGTMLWVARWYAPKGRLNAEQITEEILNLVLGGLLRASTHDATHTVTPHANGRGARPKQARQPAPLQT